MRILGLIPARGGSKGVRGKNIRLLGEKPLLQYSVEAALASSLTATILSTEDEAIAACGRQIGVNVPFMRPPELAQDHTPTLAVIRHALFFLEKEGENFDAVCLLQPTSPFRRMGLIDDCISQFVKDKAETLITVRQVPNEYNPHWVFEKNTDNSLRVSTGDETIIPRRQELPVAWHRDGQVYIVATYVLKEKNSLWGKRIVGFDNHQSPNINIDTPEDWEKAKKYLAKNAF